MSRRKIESPEHFESLWEAYTRKCDGVLVVMHELSCLRGEFVSAELRRQITYTIKDFCLFIGISRQAFYQNYATNARFIDIATRAREACEVDAREKFEKGIIPHQLAPLWMSKYGYTSHAAK